MHVHTYYDDNIINVERLIDFCVFPKSDTGDDVLLVRALDRFHRRLQALQKLLPEIGVGRYVPKIKYFFITSCLKKI